MKRFFKLVCGVGAALTLGACRQAAPPVAPESRPQTALARPQPRAARPKPAVAKKARIVYAVRTREKVFALTFDDGPHPTYTPQVLAALGKRGVTATFFMVGSMVRAHPQTARMVGKAGYPTENHSWSHPMHPRAPQIEVERTDAVMKSVLGVRNTLFRPPYGLLHNGMADAAIKRGESVIVWSSLGADWDRHATSASIAAKVLRHATPGGIALLHDGGGRRNATVAALPLIIDTLKKRGYRFVTVPQLLEMGPVVSQAPPHIKRPAGDG